MRKWKTNILALLGLASLLSSCIDDDYTPRPAAVPDAEMGLSVSFRTNVRAVGDPGEDHGEWNADWSRLGIYVVYNTGTVLRFVLNKDELKSQNIFAVFEGTATVYVAAFPDGQEPPECSNVWEVCNMQTIDVSTYGGDRQHFMQNLFSGISAETSIVKDQMTAITVTCTRPVAKVDVQWDVQAGIENGMFVEAAMSELTFNGCKTGYLFPNAKTETTVPDVATLATVSGAVSERNGRAYSYMFPGNANQLGFGITYTTTGSAKSVVPYTAKFSEELSANAWYKVNFTVSGTNVSATQGVQVTIGQ